MDEFIDKIVKETLSGHQVPYNPADWTDMKSRLEKKKKRRGFFWLWPISLMAGFVMVGSGAFWYFNGHSGTHTAMNSSTVPTSNTAGLSLTQTPVAQNTNSAAQSSTNLTPTATKAASIAKTTAPVAQPTPSAHNTTAKLANNIFSNNTHREGLTANRTADHKENAAAVATTNQDKPILNDAIPPVAAGITQTLPTAQLNTSNQNTTTHTPANITETIKKSALASNPLMPMLALPAWLKPMGSDSMALPLVNRKKFYAKASKLAVPHHIYIGGSFSPDINVRIPVGNTNMGFTLGGQLDYSLNDWVSLQSGLAYSLKRYNHETNVNLTATNGSVQNANVNQEITAHVFEIPLNLRFDILRERESTIYGIVGGSFCLRAFNNYYTQYTYTNTSTVGAVSVAFDSYLRGQQENGWMQGGSWALNHYFSANLALGYAYFLPDKYTLFIQPGYKMGLTSSGADGQKFGTFSLTMGMRKQLARTRRHKKK